MPDPQRRLILGNGEQYIQPITKPPTGRSPEPPRTYGEARTLVKAKLTDALVGFDSLPATKKVTDEAVFCLRLHPDVTAKSYSPTALFDEVPELKSVGSRYYREKTERVAQTPRMNKQRDKKETEVVGRLVFVQSSPRGYERLIRHLDRPESQLGKPFRDEIRRVERFDSLSVGEQILGFSDDWQEGRVELILHPTRAQPESQLEFVFDLFDETGVETEKSRVRQYPAGPTFVSCRLTRASLAALAGTNPLRAAHPLSFGGLTDLRNAQRAAAPKPPLSSTRSTIKVGMFDGGLDPSLPLSQGHVEEDASLEISTPADPECVMHGTAVAGVLLHGPLNGLRATSRVPTPPVYVVSIRTLPTSDPSDVDLYEAIDVVERAVPARNDIKVFNLSFGPRGPIEYDTISRFTYVLDSLAIAHKATFFVAVGNDGQVEDYDRIQAPSDLVHGLGVGAHTLQGETAIHAEYSCKGPGRECGKVKPDIAAFGGCENTPTHLVSTDSGFKLLHWGTSFASPVAARLGAQASECFERSSSLLARALLVHTASHPDGVPDNLLGHGCILTTVDDILLCDDHAVTVVFQGDILPSHVVRLPVPWPSGIVIPGKVQITWTIAALAPSIPTTPGITPPVVWRKRSIQTE